MKPRGDDAVLPDVGFGFSNASALATAPRSRRRARGPQAARSRPKELPDRGSGVPGGGRVAAPISAAAPRS